MSSSEVIIVGSGACGMQAAAALIEAGRDVTLLDFGNQDTEYAPLIPALPFSELRRTDPNQHRYFLGDRFEGVPFGRVRVGAQLTPPRTFIYRDAAESIPVASESFTPMLSLALGGLAAGWGAGVFPFTDEDLRGTPLSVQDLAPHYERVAERIGVSGERGGDLAEFFADLAATQPPLDVDTNAEQVLARYNKKRSGLNARRFFLGRTCLAVATREHRGRGPHRYLDMDFWADLDRSVYRPRWTYEELASSPHLTYLPRRLVTSFSEPPEGGVSVIAKNAETGATETHRARVLILAAGTFSTSKIVLRSLGKPGHKLPVLSNPYTYAPVINTAMIGKTPRDRRSSLAQLTAIYRPPQGTGRGIVQTQLFSYRSLLNFKLLKEAPLAFREAIPLFQQLIPLFGILGISHEDRMRPTKWVRLVEPDDRLEIEYAATAEDERGQDEDEREVIRCFRKLGCWTMRRMRPGHGTNIHYAGTLPISARDQELTTDRDGRLASTRSVYVADGSVLPYLPAKGLTFTIMANADRVATLVARGLRSST